MENEVAKNSNLWRWQALKSGFDAEKALKPAASAELPTAVKG